jgi:hypothetical protein
MVMMVMTVMVPAMAMIVAGVFSVIVRMRLAQLAAPG